MQLEEDLIYCWYSYEKILTLGAGTVWDVESPLIQQPLSSISLTISSKANVKNVTDELNIQNKKLQKTLALNNFAIRYYFKDRHSGG